MRKLLLVTLLLLITSVYPQGIILEENFNETTIPTGWAQYTMGGGSGEGNWLFGHDTFLDDDTYQYQYDSNVALFDDYLGSGSSGNDRKLLAIDGIDVSEYENLSLEYTYTLVTENAHGELKFLVLDPSTGWRTIMTHSSDEHMEVITIDISNVLVTYPDIDANNFRFGFLFDDEDYIIHGGAMVDDVKLSGNIVYDSCQSAKVVSSGGLTYASNIGAEYSDLPSCQYSPSDNGSWFHFPYIENEIKLISLWIENENPTSMDLSIKIFQGNCYSLQCVYYGSTVNISDKYLEAFPGHDYYFFVYSNNDDEGTYKLGVMAHDKPENDEADNADLVTIQTENSGCTNLITASNEGATTSITNGALPALNGETAVSDVWYQFEAPESGQIKIIFPNDSDWEYVTCGLYDSPSAATYLDYSIIAGFGLPGEMNFTNLTPGNTYYLRMASADYSDEDSNYFGTLDFCIEENTPPQNHICEQSIPLSCDSTLTGDMTNASNGVWYSYYSSNGGIVAFWTENTSYASLRLYSGACSDLVEIIDTSTDYVEIETTPETTYYAYVYSSTPEDNDEFTMNTSCTTPENDEAEGAVEITVNQYGSSCSSPTMVYNNNGATDSAPINDIPSCGSYAGGDLWYEFEAPESGSIIIQRPNTGDWGALGYAVYASPESTTPLICGYMVENDDITESDPVVDLTPGHYYWLRVWEWNNNDFGSVGICLVEDENLAIDEPITLSHVTLYPNPVSDLLTIESKQPINKILLSNVIGQNVLNKEVNNMSSLSLDTSQIPTGTYLIHLFFETSLETQKIIIK